MASSIKIKKTPVSDQVLVRFESQVSVKLLFNDYENLDSLTTFQFDGLELREYKE